MNNYLGEFDVNPEDTEFRAYRTEDWVLYFISKYGWIDGGRHKAWVIDQIARIAHGTKIIIKEAKWKNGHTEYRVDLAEPSEEYRRWVAEIQKGEDGPNTYAYDYGIAP